MKKHKRALASKGAKRQGGLPKARAKSKSVTAKAEERKLASETKRAATLGLLIRDETEPNVIYNALRYLCPSNLRVIVKMCADILVDDYIEEECHQTH